MGGDLSQGLAWQALPEEAKCAGWGINRLTDAHVLPVAVTLKTWWAGWWRGCLCCAL